MSEGGGGGADVSAMTTPSTIVIEETDGSRLRAGGDDIANLAVLAQWASADYRPETATRTMPGHSLRVPRRLAIVNRCPRFPPQNISNRDGDDDAWPSHDWP